MSRRLRVLVVEDSTDDVAQLRTELEHGGFDPDLVRVESAEALEAALRDDAWDVIIADCASRPGGVEALRIVHASGRDIPFIVVSAPGAEEPAFELMRAGAHDYIVKEKMGRLVPAVERELREAGVRRRRQQAEDALRTSEQRYRELFENASDVIFTLDPEGRFTSLNRAGQAATGFTREDASALRLSDVVAPEDQATVARVLRDETAKTNGTFQVTLIGKDGRRIPLEVNSRALVRGGRITGFEAIARDLTERRRLEAQLRQAQKMEAVGRLAGGIAHDFNNLLTAVNGYTEVLLDRLAADDPLRTNAEEIRNAAARAAGLTRQLLTFSRKQVHQPEMVDVALVIIDMERMLRRLISEDIELTTTVTTVPPVKADRGQIEQVLMNLVVNARDAMPDGGALRIATGEVTVRPDEAASYPGMQPGQYVAIEVCDTGHGMDANTLSHLFEPFFTTKEPGKGTGLGLSTVYGIVTQSGGYVAVTSAVGEGSTFRVLLPRAYQVPPRTTVRRGFESLPRGTETVLLVEDEHGVRELIRDFLTRCGYTVIEAPHVADAMTLFDEHAADISLLITDVVMPQMNGRMLAERLIGIKPTLKVLYMSGYTDDQMLVQDVAGGAGFLQKPFTPDVLARKVREVLDSPRDQPR